MKKGTYNNSRKTKIRDKGHVTMNDSINILVTVDENYVFQLNVMLASLLHSNQGLNFHVYLLHSSLEEEKTRSTEAVLGNQGTLHLIRVDNSTLENAPTSARYPKEIYYRIFAAQYLPDALDRVLYLDPDIIVNGDIRPLYQTDLGNDLFAAASHLGTFLQNFNRVRLSMEEDTPYINSGVMLMNLKLLRREQEPQAVFAYIKKNAYLLMLPDQDIISSLYGSRILELDTFRYNMTERLYTRYALVEKQFDFNWVRENSVIIHYCGRNKPWKPNYQGTLDVFYKEAVARMEQ